MTWRDSAGGIVGRVVDAVLEAVDPSEAVARHWPDDLIRVAPGSPVMVLAFGKGSVPMARAALAEFKRRQVSISRGMVIAVPTQAQEAQDLVDQGIEVLAADHPLASERNLTASRRLEDIAQGLNANWTVVCLISGGGSAHLASPMEGLSLDELNELTQRLLRAGATINELNCVRKHLETLKGGRLARLLHPARVISLVLSDVLDDPLDVISSGPTAPDPTTYEQAVAVLVRHRIDMPGIRALLSRGVSGELAETPKAADPCFERTAYRVIANNRLAVDAACDRLRMEGFEVVRRDDAVQGDAEHRGRMLGLDTLRLGSRQAIVCGGETTVRVGDSKGTGGRNQELALAAAIELDGAPGMLMASFGTDGVDGPTPAAGAYADGESVEAARSRGVDAQEALREHDSHRFFEASEGLILTGPTGTNVNDLWFALRL